MIGDFSYFGKDRVVSKSWGVLIVTLILIGVPSILETIFMYFLFLTLRIPILSDKWYWVLSIILVYVASLIFNITILFKCSFTDPGIIPIIPS